MADTETTQTPAGGTTIIEKKGSTGTVLIALVLLIAVVIGGLYLFGRQSSQNARDGAITSAAQSVGSAADHATGGSSSGGSSSGN